MIQFDVIVVGAGPAGISAALLMGKSGLKVALLEKATFPRTKICGDGITPDIISQLGLLSGELQKMVVESGFLTPYRSLILTAPNGKEVKVPLPDNAGFSSMYGCRRIDFDQLLFNCLKNTKEVTIIENCSVKSVVINDCCVEVSTANQLFSSLMVLGADGANSIVARSLGRNTILDSDKAFAVRAYYKNINFGTKGLIPRVMFHKDLLPGYLWIFPFSDGSANVGIGMSVAEMKRRRVNLESLLNVMINSMPLNTMFEQAYCDGGVKGHFIPLGNKHRMISGNRVLLAGDAAGMAHPLTGEGIGNAIRSGRIAAEHMMNCFARNNFSASFNKAFDKEVYRRTAREFTNFKHMQWLFEYEGVLNLLARLATSQLIGVLTNPETITRLQSKRLLPYRLLVQILKNW